ncbi:TPA: fimbrial protein [Enterobacter cloacae]
MGNNMKKQRGGYSLIALAMLAMSGSAAATDLNVNFTANIRETTCDMKLVGAVGDDTKQTLTIGDGNGQVRLDSIKAGTATGSFKLAITECPESLKSLKTTIKGTPSGYLPTAIVNSITASSGGGDFTAVSISRASAPTTWFTINSTTDAERLVWSTDEIKNKEVPLLATIRETQSNKATAGSFLAVATFEFTYE